MLFVSFHVKSLSTESERFSNIMLDDTIEPKNQFDLLELTAKIEDSYASRNDFINILWWKIV